MLFSEISSNPFGITSSSNTSFSIASFSIASFSIASFSSAFYSIAFFILSYHIALVVFLKRDTPLLFSIPVPLPLFPFSQFSSLLPISQPSLPKLSFIFFTPVLPRGISSAYQFSQLIWDMVKRPITHQHQPR